MLKAETFTGMIVKKHVSLFGKYILTLSDTKHTFKVECAELLYNCLCEGMHLTVTREGKQLISWHPSDSKEETFTPIREAPIYQHGKPLYYRSSRCWNTEEVRGYNHGLLTGEEIVSFDCCLFEHLPVLRREIEVPCPEHQYLAVIIEPLEPPNAEVAQDGRFTFCGYDLMEEQTQISAITNCGGGFSNVIPYSTLNQWGLFCRHTDAKKAQRRLLQAWPDEPHADCVIVEIWRYIAE